MFDERYEVVCCVKERKGGLRMDGVRGYGVEEERERRKEGKKEEDGGNDGLYENEDVKR